MKAEQSSSLQEVLPTFCNAKLERTRGRYRRRPTSASSSRGHLESERTCLAAKMGTVGALASIPRPSNKRQTKSCCQVQQGPELVTGRKQEMALKRTALRRLEQKLSGSESQQPLWGKCQRRSRWETNEVERITKRQRSPSQRASCSCHNLGSPLREEYRTWRGKTRVAVGSEKEVAECFGDLQGGSISDIHSVLISTKTRLSSLLALRRWTPRFITRRLTVPQPPRSFRSSVF